MAYFSSCVIGYLFGSLNFANLLGKLKKTDVRELGTKNAGATNVAYIFGTHVGLIVAFFDILKAILAITITRIIFPQNLYADLITGTGCVLGHIFPVFMQFKGGKGLAPLSGVVIAINVKFFLLLAILAIAMIYITHYGIAAAMVAITLFPLLMLFSTRDFIAFSIVCFISIVMFIKHIPNLKRIQEGTEVRFFTESKRKIF